MLNQLRELYELITAKTLEEINDLIKQIISDVDKKCQELELLAKEMDISVNTQKSLNYGSYIRKYLHFTPKNLSNYFSGYQKSFILGYDIRDSINFYFALLTAKHGKNFVKIRLSYNYEKDSISQIFNASIIQVYQNGSVKYKKSQELIESINLVRKINNFFNPQYQYELIEK